MPDPTDTVKRRTSSCSNPAVPGRLTLIGGCMFSGKTTELLRRLSSWPQPSALAFKHVIDRRYNPDAIVSHAGKALPAIAVTSGVEIARCTRPGTELVGIDEAHFFEADLLEATAELTARGIDVVMTSLDLDSWGRPFPLFERLGALADEPILLHATCARCGELGDRTQRLTPILDRQMVGGPESYEPRCQRCWTPPPETPPERSRSVTV